MENITLKFKEFLENQSAKRAIRALAFLDRDLLVLYLDLNGVVFIDGTCPNYVRDQILKFAKKHGYRMWFEQRIKGLR